MATQRWIWPGILVIPGAALVVHEFLTFRNFYAGESQVEQVRTIVGWGLLVAAPYVVVAVLIGITVRRNRSAWWLSLVTSAAVVGIGLLLAVGSADAMAKNPEDSLAGIGFVIAPFVQLGVAVGLGVAVVVISVPSRKTNPALTQV